VDSNPIVLGTAARGRPRLPLPPGVPLRRASPDDLPAVDPAPEDLAHRRGVPSCLATLVGPRGRRRLVIQCVGDALPAPALVREPEDAEHDGRLDGIDPAVDVGSLTIQSQDLDVVVPELPATRHVAGLRLLQRAVTGPLLRLDPFDLRGEPGHGNPEAASLMKTAFEYVNASPTLPVMP
jgi:hypothetical protein